MFYLKNFLFNKHGKLRLVSVQTLPFPIDGRNGRKRKRKKKRSCGPMNHQNNQESEQFLVNFSDKTGEISVNYG